jgi:hypothetical protein
MTSMTLSMVRSTNNSQYERGMTPSRSHMMAAKTELRMR